MIESILWSLVWFVTGSLFGKYVWGKIKKNLK